MSGKTKPMQDFIDALTENFFGISNSSALDKGVCVICKKEVKNFRDDLSRKEYNISGMCQKCQDKIFNG